MGEFRNLTSHCLPGGSGKSTFVNPLPLFFEDTPANNMNRPKQSSSFQPLVSFDYYLPFFLFFINKVKQVTS